MTKTTPKIEYSEHEAATMLGVSIDQLRSMIRNHIVKDEAAGAPHLCRRFKLQILLSFGSSPACREMRRERNPVLRPDQPPAWHTIVPSTSTTRRHGWRNSDFLDWASWVTPWLAISYKLDTTSVFGRIRPTRPVS